MTSSIAVIGNSMRNVGAPMAGDLALGGHDVRLALFADQSDLLEAIRSTGGISITAPADKTLCGHNGLGKLRVLTSDPAEAVAGADLVVLDVEPMELEDRAADVIPHLENGQVLYVNSHGYWPSLRLAPALRAADKAGVTILEGIAPNVGSRRTGAEVTSYYVRREVPFAAFPANRTADAERFLPFISPSAELLRDVIETNFENLNMLVHPAMTLLNVGYFDRAEAAGDPISFYGTGNTAHAGKLAEALDAERTPACAAYGVRYRSLLDHIHRIYGAGGDTVHEAVEQAPVYNSSGGMRATIWQTWMEGDLPLSHVPFVELAESAGVSAPLRRGFVDILDALLGTNSWKDGLNLKRLGLAGMSVEQIRQYVETGNPDA